MDFGTLHPMYYMWTVNTNVFLSLNPQAPTLLDLNTFNLQNSAFEPESVKREKFETSTSSQVSLPKKKKKNQKIIDDDEYEIQKNRKKKVLMDQKEGRNAASNILRSFFKFLESPVTLKLMEKLPECQVTREDLLCWFRQNDIHYRNYIRMSSVKNMLSRSERHLVKAFLFLLENYLQNFCRLHFLNSQKLKQKNKLITLKQIRLIKEEIHNQFIFNEIIE